MTPKPGIPLNEPRTEAGRALLADMRRDESVLAGMAVSPGIRFGPQFFEALESAILAIEREARGIPLIDVERPTDDEHAALILAAAMKEAGYIGDTEAAWTILAFLAAPDQGGWDERLGWGLARLASESSIPVEPPKRSLSGYIAAVNEEWRAGRTVPWSEVKQRMDQAERDEIAAAGCFLADHGADPAPCRAHEEWAAAMLIAIKARRDYVAPTSVIESSGTEGHGVEL